MCYITDIMNIFEHDNYRKIVQKWVYEQLNMVAGLYLKWRNIWGLIQAYLVKSLMANAS